MTNQNKQLFAAKQSALKTIKAGQWPQAQAMIVQILRADDNDPDVWYWLGLCQANQKAHLMAVESFKRSILLKPKHAPAQDALGNALLYLEQVDEAIDAFEKAVKAKPKFSEAHSHLGNAYRLKRMYAKAETCLKKALKLNANDNMATYNLGLVYKERRNYVEACKFFRKAIAKNSQFGEAYNELGNTYQLTADLEKAVESYKQAVALLPGSSNPLVNLGLVYEKKHCLDEANQAAEAALKIDKNNVGATLLYARLAKRSGAYDDASTRLQNVLSEDVPAKLYSAVSTELGHILDKQGNYDGAYDAFLKANNAWLNDLKTSNLNMDSFLHHIELNRQYFSRETVSSWNTHFDDEMSDPVFLVGFPRSGTTLMEQILESHPNLMGSREEPFLQSMISQLAKLLARKFTYPEDLETLTENEILKLRKHYWNSVKVSLGDELQHKRLVDKLPFNIVDLGMINRLFPESRVIVALRDPRDCCLSCFMQVFEINQAMAQFLDMGTTTRLYSKVMELWLHYKETLSLQMLDYRYEDLVENLPDMARKILQFIGEDWDEGVLQYYETAKGRYANTPSYQAVTQPIYKGAMERWRNYEKYLQPHQAFLLPYIKEFGYVES